MTYQNFMVSLFHIETHEVHMENQDEQIQQVIKLLLRAELAESDFLPLKAELVRWRAIYNLLQMQPLFLQELESVFWKEYSDIIDEINVVAELENWT